MAKSKRRKPLNDVFLADLVGSLTRDGFDDITPSSVKIVLPGNGCGCLRWSGFICDHCRTRFEDTEAVVFLRRGSTDRFTVCTNRPACRERYTNYLAAAKQVGSVSRRRLELQRLKRRVRL